MNIELRRAEADVAIHLFVVWLTFAMGLIAPIVLAVVLWLSPSIRAKLGSYVIYVEALEIWIAFGFLIFLAASGAWHRSTTRLDSSPASDTARKPIEIK